MTDATIALKLSTKGLKEGQREIDKLGKKGKEAETNLNKSTQNLNKSWSTSTKAIAGVTSALVAMGAVKVFSNAIKTTAEFSQSIADLSAITGATGKDLEFYSKQAAEIGRTTSLSASQAATAFKLIASAKPELLESAESLAAVTKEAVTLAEATGSSLPEAASALGSALNQFQLPASDASRVINALAASSQLGTAEVGAVTEAMRNAGSAANSLGLDFEETVAGIQALAASGRQGADAGTALRQVLLQLESTADKDLMPSLVGLDGALQELATRNLDNTQLMDLFGKEAFTAAASLLAQKDIVTDLNVSLRDTSTATDQAAIRMDTFSGDVLSLKSAIDGLQIEAFSSGLDGLGRSAVQTATGGINLLTENLDHVGSAAKVLATILTVRMIPALAQTATRMAAAAISATQLGGALTLLGGPVGIAALAAGSVVALAMAFKSLREEQERARKSAASYISGNGGLESIDLAIIGTQKEIERLREVIKEDNGIFSHFVGSQSNKARDRIKELESFLADLKREHEALRTQQENNTETTEKYTGAVDTLTGAMIPFNMETIVANEQLVDMGIILSRLEKGEFTAVKKVIADTTFRMQGMITATDELTSSIGETGTATGTLATTTTTSTESMETDLGRLGNTAVDTFAQMLVSGGDAMDGLKRVFENAIADMISTFVKSGIKDLFNGGNFTFGMGGGGGSSASSLLSGGSSLASLGGSAAGFLSGVTGSATGIAAGTVGPPTAAAMAGSGLTAGVAGIGSSIAGAASSAGSAVLGALGAIPGWGWALGGAAVLAKVLDDSGTMSSNAGMLTQDLGHAGSFDIDPFASGAEFTGFARRSDQQGATENIDAFREVDGYLTNVYKEIYGSAPNLNASDFVGYDEKGQGRGAFFGAASEDGGSDGTPIDQQLTNYASRWLELAGAGQGVSQSEVKAWLGGSSSVADVLSKAGNLAQVDGSHGSGLNRVPFDGYVAQLHKGERVKTASEARQEDSMASMMGDLKVQIVRNTQLMLSIVQRWDFDGLPATRT